MLLNVTRLDEYSRFVAQWFFETYPEWQQYATNDPDHEGALLVEIPSPTGSSDGQLIICTAHGEITLYFEWSFRHIGWAEQTDEDVLGDAKGFIDDLINERLLIAVKRVGSKWEYSQFLAAEELDQLDREEFSYLRSWRGTYDRSWGDSER